MKVQIGETQHNPFPVYDHRSRLSDSMLKNVCFALSDFTVPLLCKPIMQQSSLSLELLMILAYCCLTSFWQASRCLNIFPPLPSSGACFFYFCCVVIPP